MAVKSLGTYQVWDLGVGPSCTEYIVPVASIVPVVLAGAYMPALYAERDHYGSTRR